MADADWVPGPPSQQAAPYIPAETQQRVACVSVSSELAKIKLTSEGTA